MGEYSDGQSSCGRGSTTVGLAVDGLALSVLSPVARAYVHVRPGVSLTIAERDGTSTFVCLSEPGGYSFSGGSARCPAR